MKNKIKMMLAVFLCKACNFLIEYHEKKAKKIYQKVQPWIENLSSIDED